MKIKIFLILLGITIFTLGFSRFSFNCFVVKWQMDDIRQNNKKVDEESILILEFNKTNTNQRLTANKTKFHIPIRITKENNIELGYRSDGAVVWRIFPETQ